jgi:hypothetical protein
MKYEKKNQQSAHLINLLRQRFTGSDGKLIRGAKSRIAEHIGVSYGSVSQWFEAGKACNHRHHNKIAHLILSGVEFSARKTGPKLCRPNLGPD